MAYGVETACRGLAIAALTGLLVGCGGGDGAEAVAQMAPPSTIAPETPPAAAATNSAPTIAGNAATTAEVGKAYSFTPSAADADHDNLKFSISSLPRWAKFDDTSGRVYGTPAKNDVGSHEEITITASDGKATASLPEFAISVKDAPAAGLASVTVSWVPPDENTDGTPLTGLSGYRIHYGTASKKYTQTIDVENAGLTRYVVDNLKPGTYYFSVTAVSATGAESELSKEASGKIS
jgi:Putative Ig domain/Fibronectin type III domain